VDVNAVLVETFDRLPDLVRGAVEGLTAEQLRWSPASGANTVGWLIWHLTRVQDHHMAEILAQDQIWVSGDWSIHFGLEAEPNNTGYGHSPQQVDAVRPEGAQVLIDYYTVVAARTREFLNDLTPEDLDRVVDKRWDPPVTLGVRLVSIANDDVAHVGQAAYLRGLLALRS
jgi:uncharacterized damage-inducible protein DinB